MKGSGISFFDVTANVTLDRVVVTDTARDGITLTPTCHGDQLILSDIIYPTLRLCDTNVNMFVKPGVDYKFFPLSASYWSGCIRRFETEERYAIRLTMKAETTSYSAVLAADFYEGNNVDIKNRIGQFKVYSEGSGPQVCRNKLILMWFSEQRNTYTK